MDVVEELRNHCMAKDGAAEDYPWGDIAWKVKGKMFACTSPESTRVTVKSTLEKQAALIQHPAIEVAQYVGRYGWITLDVVDEEMLELAKDLIDESYESIKGGKKRSR